MPEQLDFLPSQLRMRSLYNPDVLGYGYMDGGATQGPASPFQAEAGRSLPSPGQVPVDMMQPLRFGGQDSPLNPAPEPEAIEARIENDPRTQIEAPSAFKRQTRPLSSVASDQFIQFLNTYPERPNPRTSDRIGAAIAAFTGDPARVEHALYGNYNRQLQDWKVKGDILSQAANFERATNQQILADEDRDALNEYRQGQLDRQTREDESEAAKRKADIERDKRREATREKMLQMRKFVVNRETGKTYGWNPITNQAEEVTVGDLDFADRVAIQAAGAITIANDRQDFDSKMAALKQEWEQANIRLRGEVQQQTNALRPTNANIMSPEEEIKEIQLAAEEWKREHQDQADWIVFDPTTKLPIIDPPQSNFGNLFGGLNAEMRKKIIDEFNKYIRDRVEVKRKSMGATPPQAPSGAVQGPGSSSIRPGGTGGRGNTGGGSTGGGSRFPSINLNDYTGDNKSKTETTRTAPSSGVKAWDTEGTPPPLAQRKIGQKHRFTSGPSAGKVGTWSADGWLIPEN